MDPLEETFEEALEESVRNGELPRIQALIRRGADVNQWCERGSLLIEAISGGYQDVALELLRAGADTYQPDVRGQTAFQWACSMQMTEVAQVLIDKGSPVDEPYGAAHKSLSKTRLMNSPISFIPAISTKPHASTAHSTRDSQGKCTPLMDAVSNGHEKIVKMLILAGANLEIQNENGDTALHLAANHNCIQCGILLVEGGASVMTKNSDHQTPFDLSTCTKEFKKAITEALSFTTRKTLCTCVIGNAEGGKSTLIEALQAECNSSVGKLFGRLKRVDDKRKRTAGIETIPHSSKEYGEVLFYDFAGQNDYHGPHQIFLESLLSNPGVSMILLLVVNVTEEENTILDQLYRWLSPLALVATPARPPRVIVVGSFLDKVKSKQEATASLCRCIEATKTKLVELPLEFVGYCLLNCRQPQSEGINQLCRFLQDVPIPEFRATHAQYSLAWVLSQIKSFFTSPAVQLNEFSTWLHDNKDNLPRTMPPAEKVCRDLSAAGHALYLSNKEDSTKSWLVLDLPSILQDVYGTLFSQSRGIISKFGLLNHPHLDRFFPHLDLEMIRQLLISLEFCIPVEPSVLRAELSKLTQSEEAIGWLFFPALIPAEPMSPTSEGSSQQCPHFCWQLRTTNKHRIFAHLLQTIILRLAAHFAPTQRTEDRDQLHCCNIWQNGIAWQSNVGINVTVYIIDNKVVRVIGASKTSADKTCRYLIGVIDTILLTVYQLSPKLAAVTDIVHPETAAVCKDLTDLTDLDLFPVEDIQRSIIAQEDFVLSLTDFHYKRTQLLISKLFSGFSPTEEDMKKMLWPRPALNQPQTLSELHEENTPRQIPSRHASNSTFFSDSSATLTTSFDRPPIPIAARASTDPPPTPTTASTNPVAPIRALTNPPPASSAVNNVSESLNSLSLQGAQALLDISSKPTLRDIEELIVTHVASKFRPVAIAFGVEASVINTEKVNHPNDCEGACTAVFDRWLRGSRHTGEEQRTWSVLLAALGKADFADLERRLRREQFKAE